jgi:hypothetical protein
MEVIVRERIEEQRASGGLRNTSNNVNAELIGMCLFGDEIVNCTKVYRF